MGGEEQAASRSDFFPRALDLLFCLVAQANRSSARDFIGPGEIGLREWSLFAGYYGGIQFEDHGSREGQKGIQKKELVVAETYARPAWEKPGPEAPTDSQDLTLEGRPPNAL